MCRAGVLSLKAGRPERSTIKGRHVIVTVLLSRSYRKILVSTIKVAKTLDVNVPGIFPSSLSRGSSACFVVRYEGVW